MQNTQNEDIVEIDLQELFGLLVHWLWVIVICGIAAGAVGFAVSFFVLTPQYESTTKVYILNKTADNLTYNDLQTGTQLTKDYTQLIKSREVLETVIATCGLDEKYDAFAKRVRVEALPDTRIIAITVTDESPAMAKLLASEICKVASEHIKNVMDLQAVNIAEEAYLPEGPSSPSVVKWTVVGALVGIFLSAMIIILRSLMDDTVKTSEDIEKYLELSTLAMIPVIEDADKKKGRKVRRMGKAEIPAAVPNSHLEATEEEIIVEELDTSEAAAKERI